MSLIRYPALRLDSILNAMGISRKIRFVYNLWLGGPFDQSSTHLNWILHDLFWDSPLNHIRGSKICAPITVFCVFGTCILACQIPSNGVSMKRPCKMFRTEVNRTAQSKRQKYAFFFKGAGYFHSAGQSDAGELGFGTSEHPIFMKLLPDHLWH